MERSSVPRVADVRCDCSCILRWKGWTWEKSAVASILWSARVWWITLVSMLASWFTFSRAYTESLLAGYIPQILIRFLWRHLRLLMVRVKGYLSSPHWNWTLRVAPTVLSLRHPGEHYTAEQRSCIATWMDFRNSRKKVNKGDRRNNEKGHIHKSILQRNNFCNKVYK